MVARHHCHIPRLHQDTLSWPSMAATTPKIELIYDPDCPNVERARERLSHAVAGRDVAAREAHAASTTKATEPSTRPLPSP